MGNLYEKIGVTYCKSKRTFINDKSRQSLKRQSKRKEKEKEERQKNEKGLLERKISVNGS